MKILQSLGSKSLLALLMGYVFLFSFRITHVNEKEISWDNLGYYLYLSSTFVHEDPLLTDIEWLKKLNEEKQLAGTLYMVSYTDDGEPMYFFLMGMSIFYAPSFFIAHSLAPALGYEADGFSWPYQYALVLGGLLYTLIGLIYLRKILLEFFTENVSAIILLLIVFGTNYVHHLTLDNMGTVNVIFMLNTLIIWHTINWNKNYSRKYLIYITAFLSLLALVKPSEVASAFIPLLWNATSWKDIKANFFRITGNFKTFGTLLIVALVILSPQLIYWYIKTGSFVYDSYKNPGVGLDFFSPNLSKSLFSYRKGWLLYTPLMILSLIGFYPLYKHYRKIFLACLVYFLISLWIISSWSEWWYGAGFSNRPLIATYPILALSLGAFITQIGKATIFLRTLVGAFAVFCIFLNQFQWWQLRHYILDPYRTNKEYYWATFLKTHVSAEDRKLRRVYRDFSGENTFENRENYIVSEDPSFSEASVQEVSSNETFKGIYESTYEELLQKDHGWVECKMEYRSKQEADSTIFYVVMAMHHSGDAYAYYAFPSSLYANDSTWHQFSEVYLTPEIRQKKDVFKTYIWNRYGADFEIRNLEFTVYEPKKGDPY